MNDKFKTLKEAFDESILYKIRFVKRDGKLRMVSKKSVSADDQLMLTKPMFPISKDRK